ncbi:MAG: hypothetical protein DKT66_04395 [Candidatus Melainabacteria bacterium]|nr:MAG: hypothetical protein DKT66_04395 [Candidatus Melainabacteria bacterium]
MVSFTDAVDVWDRLDFQLLLDGAVTLYYSADIMHEDCEWLKQHKYKVRDLDASNWNTEAAFHADVKRILEFPSYYGENLNAFSDCLSDLEMDEDGGFAIAIRHFNSFFRVMPDRAQAVLDIIETNSRRHLLIGKRLIALVQTDNPRVVYEHVGCITPSWNPRERMERNRGL